MTPKQIFITTCKSILFFIGFGVLCTLGSELFMCVNLRGDPEISKIFIDFMATAAGIFCFIFGFGSLGMVFMIWEHDNFAKPGEKVIFLNENGYDHQRQQASRIFEVGQVLVVEEINIGSFSSTYKFKNHKNYYNTVMFERLS